MHSMHAHTYDAQTMTMMTWEGHDGSLALLVPSCRTVGNIYTEVPICADHWRCLVHSKSSRPCWTHITHSINAPLGHCAAMAKAG